MHKPLTNHFSAQACQFVCVTKVEEESSLKSCQWKVIDELHSDDIFFRGFDAEVPRM